MGYRDISVHHAHARARAATKCRVTPVLAGSSRHLSDDTDLCTGVDVRAPIPKIGADDKAGLKATRVTRDCDAREP